MNINKYISKVLVNEYATKDFTTGYSLNISDIPQYELDTFLSVLLKHDDSLRCKIRILMQDHIDSILPRIESQDRYDAGYIPQHDNLTGEVNWVAQLAQMGAA